MSRALGEIREQRLNVDGAQVRGEACGLEPCGGEHVFHEAVELREVALDVGDAARAVALVRQELERHADPRERRAQLVRHVGE